MNVFDSPEYETKSMKVALHEADVRFVTDLRAKGLTEDEIAVHCECSVEHVRKLLADGGRK